MGLLKVIEWNINQRVNYAQRNMPEWIADVILEKDADIIALTEAYKGNNWEIVKNRAFPSNYHVFESANGQYGQNDVVIAVNNCKLDVLYSKSFVSDSTAGVPDHLEVKCRDKMTGKEFVFVCVRIHAGVSQKVRRKEFSLILKTYENDENVIICGDFNNFRKGYSEAGGWCLSEIDNLIHDYKYKRKTPDGSSLWLESKDDPDFQFAEDHFFIKGKNLTLSGREFCYDRSFVEKDRTVYKYGNDFEKIIGKDSAGKTLYECVPPPFPDHAVLSGVIIISES